MKSIVVNHGAKKGQRIANPEEFPLSSSEKFYQMKNGCTEVLANRTSRDKKSKGRASTRQKKLRRSDHVFTLGIEEEFQIIDPITRELRSHIQQILADGKMMLKEH